MSVLHNTQLGHDVYDFLAGEAQYKRSLSTNEETVTWVGLHRRSTAFTVEEVLRHAKRRLFRTMQVRSSPVGPTAAAAANVLLPSPPCPAARELGNGQQLRKPATFMQVEVQLGRD